MVIVADDRKQQLEEAIDDASKRQAVFEKHPPQQAANTILVYVKSARMALGPPTLKVTALVDVKYYASPYFEGQNLIGLEYCQYSLSNILCWAGLRLHSVPVA